MINLNFVFYIGTHKSCNVNYLTPTGVVTVPDIASLQGQDLSCKLHINAKFSDYIRLNWMEFGSNLFTKPNSCQNSIEIYNGQTTKLPDLVSKKCNADLGPNVQVEGGNVTVKYNIKKYQSNKNFRKNFKVAFRI